ncbi:exonuclease SbcC [Nitrosomonas aestuarii]|uniref:Exonuclease SbcC n=1 Tax=Nitrosomonas aestuarii TaxID=52441 RepID=A0A1I4FTB6_9PROT|nr:AAA family ATPase [Nitrosomonas aestuarii]SFL20237.1 exonuclease SbcC [Nitrosomonas aestuarii]
MRILQVRFQNLNSLIGEWAIDFTHPAFVSDGIFVITGPTGAGKTTILDAICLALYGRTPRLNKVTKGNNEIMSRQMGECFSEVTFATQAGRYRCHWSQHRARKKQDGELQAPRHEIAEADSGKVLETKMIEVAQKIEKVTGMDFDRFTRSMLLAQGGFAAFLQADSDERAPLLEQITGTDIYSRISIKVHERQRVEREKLNLLQAEISCITILTSEQVIEMNRELHEKQKQETEIAAKILQTVDALAWLRNIDDLQSEVNTLSAAIEKLNVEFAVFKPELERLRRAEKAAEFDGHYATLISLRQQQLEDRQSLKAEESKLPEVTSYVQKTEQMLKGAEQIAVKTRKAQKAAAPLIQKIRSLDQQLLDRKKIIEAAAEQRENIAEQIALDKRILTQEQKKLEAARNDLKQIQEYLQNNARDERLVSDLTGIEEQLNTLISVQKDIAEKKATLEKVIEQLQSTRKNLTVQADLLTVRRQDLLAVQKKSERRKNDLNTLLDNRLLREYRAEKDTLLHEMTLLRRIADLESERIRLEDGKPCPLCGSTEHPFAAGNVPQMDEAEKKIMKLAAFIEKAERLEAEIKVLEAAEKQALKEVTVYEKLETDAANEQRNVEQSLQDMTLALEKSSQYFVELNRSALARLQPLDIQEMPGTDLLLFLESLKKRLDNWRNRIAQQAVIEKRIAQLESNLKKLIAVIDTQDKALLEKQSVLKTLKKEFEMLSVERENLFGIRNPDAEEVRLEKAVLDAELKEKTERLSWDEARQLHHTITTHIASQKARIDKKEPELQKLEAAFLNSLQSAGFDHEQLFVAERLTLQEREKIKTEAKALDDRYADLQARKKDREHRLMIEIGKKMTASKRETLEHESKLSEQTLKLLREDIAGLNHKLMYNRAAIKKIKEKQTLVEAQKSECDRWDQLHSLIGSADGKKYRNFAQGLTFEIMIGHANRQLQKLTDRYLLMRDDAQPLELNVIDNYQNGEIRSTKNLSGGESFIVSLSLALGLSHMASKNVRVDSLFLDEGFGTLDEDVLDTALEALASLQQNGKLIGVISHVPMLKERINTQIQVTPGTGGRSRIDGPGVVSMS